MKSKCLITQIRTIKYNTRLYKKKINNINKCSVILNSIDTHIIKNYRFDNLPKTFIDEIFKDGRPFSHFIEKWIENKYPLQHISGCKSYDFIDKQYPNTFYDQKTFTKRGCHFCPSNMLGVGRTFNKNLFIEKTNKLIFCIVSNINFPEIKVKFIRGTDLLKLYPTGKIPLKDHIKFFN